MKVFHKKMLVAAMVACFVLAGLPLSAHAQSPQITSGLSYLSANQNQDGSWSEVFTADFVSTAEVLSAFAVLNNKDTVYTNGLNWLTSQTIDTTDYLARRVIISGSSYSVTDLNTTLSYQNSDSGFGGYLEYTSNNLDTALSLLALQSANYADSTIINNAIT